MAKSIYEDDEMDNLLSGSVIGKVPSYKGPTAVLETMEGDDLGLGGGDGGDDEYADVRNKTLGNVMANSEAESAEMIEKRRKHRARVVVGMVSRGISLAFKIIYKQFVNGKFLTKVRTAIILLEEKKKKSGTLSETEKDALIELSSLERRLSEKERKFEDLIKHKPDQLDLFTEGVFGYLEVKNINPSPFSSMVWSGVELVLSPIFELGQEIFLSRNKEEELLFDLKYSSIL